MKQLVEFLLNNIILDFKGDIDLDTFREFLRGDESREAKALLQRVIEERGVDNLLLALADVLQENIRSGVTAEQIRENLNLYVES
ncbi:MAG TPA: hypothetical protein VG389_23680 [Myxococcota bacterium]|jgi:hypothetical protein|nr:hypothetical protein [Myxococcota bacterium]